MNWHVKKTHGIMAGIPFHNHHGQFVSEDMLISMGVYWFLDRSPAYRLSSQFPDLLIKKIKNKGIPSDFLFGLKGSRTC